MTFVSQTIRRRLMLLLPALLVVASLAMCACATAGPTSWDKGFNFTTWSPGGYAGSSAMDSLERLRRTGANAIALIPTWYQETATSTAIAPDSRLSPTDESIASVVASANRAGLKVLLRPVVDAKSGTSRANFAPDPPRAWFESYRRFINHYAELGHALGVDMLSVGHEYHNVDGPQYAAEWRKVIAGVRKRFSGPLTYGALNADAWTHIPFWGALDVIGIDAYFTLSDGPTPAVDEIAARWHSFTDKDGVTHHYVDEMAALSARYRKPIVFTELGYPSAVDALVRPWAEGQTYSGQEQARAFEGAFRALAGEAWFKGLYIWDWSVDPAAGGAGDTGHTPQNKPAEETITRWFTEATPTPARRSIRLSRVSLRDRRLTVRGSIRGRVRGRVRVAYAVPMRARLLRRARQVVARRGRFAVRFTLPRAAARRSWVRRGTLKITWRGDRAQRPRTARIALAGLPLR